MTRSILTLVPAATVTASQPWPTTARIAITRDGLGLAEVLGHALSQLGYQVSIAAELSADCDIAIVLDALQSFVGQKQAIALNEQLFAHAKKIAPHFSTHGGILLAVQNLG